jgi:3',5'-cyclic AMP phosphodiesterase CpdA
MKKILLFLVVILFTDLSLAQKYNTPETPQRIIINLTDTPSSSMAVTWRTMTEVSNPQIKYSETTEWRDIDSSCTVINAKSEKVKIDSNTFAFHHSAVLKNLNANTIYSYKVGGGKDWSEWNQFTTASDTDTPFEFIFFGDPQVDVKEYVSRIFRKSLTVSPNAKFWLFTGDLMDRPLDQYWEELFYAGGFVFSLIPSVMTPGSHEYAYKLKDGTRVNQFSPLWYSHFTLPENGIPGMEEKSFFFDYQGVRFIMLDAQSKLEEQAAWLDSLLEKTRNQWKIVAFHEPVFSMGRNRDELKTRDAFMSIIEKHNVDLVLTGHDHVYARSYKLKNEKIVSNDDKGTVYVISQCGGKTYPLNTKNSELMAKTGTNIQLFQTISIDKKKIIYKSYSVTGKLFDSFELTK